MHKLCIHIEGDRRDRGGKLIARWCKHTTTRASPPPPSPHPPSTSVPKKYSLVVFPLS